MGEPDALKHETELFERRLDEWRRTHLGEVVLIKGDDVVGFFGSLDQAFAQGMQRFGLEPFFVKQIVPRDVVNVSMYGRRILAAN